ncbi:hypothetical protein BDZ97DRAFT_782807 [Flammula alnicola]|nr:hypothetical protein BDZ97DRAFT_782807 [Flammula alnicola]
MDILIFILMVQFWNKTKPLVEDFLFYRRGEVDIILSDLHSLVGVPPPGDESTELRIFHASLLTSSSIALVRENLYRFQRRSYEAHKIQHKAFKITALSGWRSHSDTPFTVTFMLHCVESQPSLQLLKDLYDFDVRTHLEFWTSEDNVIGVYEHDAKRIITLIMWLQDQRHPDSRLIYSTII